MTQSEYNNKNSFFSQDDENKVKEQQETIDNLESDLKNLNDKLIKSDKNLKNAL